MEMHTVRTITRKNIMKDLEFECFPQLFLICVFWI